jgi:hypothetical protein
MKLLKHNLAIVRLHLLVQSPSTSNNFILTESLSTSRQHFCRHNPDSYRYLLRMRPVNHQDRRIGHNPDSYQHFLRMRPGTDALDSRDAGMENSRTDESRDQTESLPQLHLPRLNHSEDLSC